MPRFNRSTLISKPAWACRLLAVCALLGAGLAAPALAQGLSLTQALAQAMAANPQLAAARQEIGIAQGARDQAGVMPNPELSYEVEDTDRNSSTTTITLSQALELGGKRGARIEAASYGQSVAQLELARQVNSLRADVVQAFHAALRAQVGVDLARQSQQLGERGLKVVDGRVRAGKSSPVEATRAQVELAEARLQLRRAETEQAMAYQNLALISGSATADVQRLDAPGLSPGLPPSSVDLLARLEQTAEMRHALAVIDQSDAALGSEKALRVPNLTVSVGSQYDRAVRERVNVVGLSMPLPLFDRNQGNVLSAARRADQARDQRNAVEQRLRSETQAALLQWTRAMHEVETYEQTILPAAQQALDSATRGFEMGKFGFIEVLDAQRTLITARGQYLDSLGAASAARAQVERIYGDLDGAVAAR